MGQVTPTNVTVYDVEQRSPEWYAARLGIVTASAIGKLLTPTLKVANNETARGLIATLVAERITGRSEDTAMTPDMWRGVEHEPYARDIYSGLYQQAVETGFMRRDEDDWTLGYSPDGLVADDGLIEIKCPRAKGHLNTILNDRVPDQYMPQLQAGLLVTGRKWIDYVSFFAGMPLYVKRVTPDPAWQNALIEAASAFEAAAAEILGLYGTASTGLHPTQPLDLNTVELKLA